MNYSLLGQGYGLYGSKSNLVTLSELMLMKGKRIFTT